MLKATLPQFGPIETLGGWTNRILRIDLSEPRIWAQPTAPAAECR